MHSSLIWTLRTIMSLVLTNICIASNALGGELMLSNKVQAVVMAAGKSTRFKTGRTKLLEKICGQEMIIYITRLLEQAGIPATIIVGYQRDAVIEKIKEKHRDGITFVVQEEQRGTGHAVRCTQETWFREHILVMNGDMPLVTVDTLQRLYDKHVNANADVSLVVSHCDEQQATGYGRIITTENGIKIVEAKDFTGSTSDHCCINAGIYLFSRTFLEKYIDMLTENAKTKELYLTDLIKMACDQGLKVVTIEAPFDQIRGINNFQELWAAEQIKRAELIKYWMDNGVRFSVAQNVHIDLDVTIGAGSYVGCGVHLLGQTRIGKNCKINEFSSLEDTVLGDNTVIYPHCIISHTTTGENVQIGPFAHLRDNNTLADNVIIGNFVEVKQSTIGNDSRAKHLAYLGDATIGTNVNIGAGTITCNHNGKTKHKTVIGNNAFIGSNNTLVAPITIAENSFTAAGSVITDNVPAETLAIARARQINKEGYARKLREKPTECACAPLETASLSFMGALKTKKADASR